MREEGGDIGTDLQQASQLRNENIHIFSNVEILANEMIVSVETF